MMELEEYLEGRGAGEVSEQNYASCAEACDGK